MRIALLSLLLFFSQTLQAQEYMKPEKALDRLMEGNMRFVKDQEKHPNETTERRRAIIEKQEPFAVILGCSDSRVAPEIVFDQGLGDLFIVRVAGNVVAPVELDSIEYSAIYLHSSLVLVLGHQDCGAVKAVMEGQTKDIEAVANLIEPAIKGSTQLESAIKANVKSIVDQLNSAPQLKALVAKKKLMIKGGYYDMNTGKVNLL